MKKTFLFIACLLAALSTNAQNKKVNIVKAEASSSQTGVSPSLVIDGDYGTFWHTPYDEYNGSSTSFPITLTVTFEETTHVGFMRYVPRQDGGYFSGNWTGDVFVAYCPTTTGSTFRNIGSYRLSGDDAVFDFPLGDEGIECGQIRFTINSGVMYYASAAEIEAYTYDNISQDDIAPYFTDELFTQLKADVTSSEGIGNEVVKTLVDNLLANAEEYHKFRVGEYEPYLTTQTLKNILKSSNSYNNYENPTGVYLKAGQPCWVAVSGIDERYPVGLTIKNWVTDEKSSYYTLRNGLNYITSSNEGNVFVSYYTDDFEIAPNVKVHFINAPVQGYWDQATMTNDDWVKLLKGRSHSDNSILITRSEHAQLAFPVSAWLKYCPTNVDSTMTLYQQVQWAQRNMLGLEKYGRQVKNRQLYFATDYAFMAAVEEGAFCNVNSLDAIMVPDSKRFDFWGVGHEWGHNNQISTGFKWSGCGETTNNIFASWGQIHFTGKPHYLRLEDEVTGVGEYSGMRGGRMQTYFEEALRKGVPWQLQDGPDYYGSTPNEKTVWGYDADGNYLGYVPTTSRNYDHFVKLVPFWQLNLWGTLAGKCPDIIPMVIESIRTTENYTHYYNTNGQKQVNWMKLACDSAKIDLLPFFEKAGMLRPINAYIEDYNAGWNVISEKMINDLKAYVKEQGYPAFTEEINYINGHNYRIYRDCLSLDVPKELNEGCTLNNNRVTVQHDIVKNAVAFETYNEQGELLRITMYGLGSDDNHSFTQVLYPKNKDASLSAAYIMAVGYDGTRIKIYEGGGARDKFFELLAQAKDYAERTDATGRKVGFLNPEQLAEFTALIAKMDSLVENTDSRERPYAQWSAELAESLPTLVNYCNPMTPNRFYSLASYSDLSIYASNTANGLKADTYKGEDIPASLVWRFIETDTEGVYHMRHRTSGQYVTSAESGQRVKADSHDAANALAFTITVATPGEIFIQRADDTDVRLYYSNSYVYAGNQTGSNARWMVEMTDDQTEDDMLGLPETSTGEEITVYYILDIDNGEYLYYKDFGRNDKGCISSKLYESTSNFNYWFYFTEGSQDGKYVIHNYASKLPVTVSNGLLYANKKADPAPEYTITLNEEGTALTIMTEEGAWKGTAQERARVSATDATNWKLQRVCTVTDPTGISHTNTDILIAHQGSHIIVSGLAIGTQVMIYDIMGRQIATATASSTTAVIETNLSKGSVAIVKVEGYTYKLKM